MTIHVVNKYTHVPTDRDVYIGRPSQLGNPYLIGPKWARGETISAYKAWLADRIKANDQGVCDALNAIWKLAQTGDVYLVCYCAPLACHGDVVKATVEART